MSAPREVQADVLVLGSGPGGAVTAALCAEDGHDVVVCEEGPWVEQGSVAQFSLDQMTAQYRHNGVTAALGRPAIAYAEARCAGGGSEVNSGLYHRPPEDVLAEWRRDFGVRDLATADVYALSETLERDLSIGKAGDGVPPPSKMLDAGARALAWSVTEVPRWVGPDGRKTMTRTFLPRAQAAGARVLTGMRAVRILHDGGNARGALCAAGVGPTTVVRAKHVVVACGAVHTPALLLRSGIKHHVGRTLRMHPTVKAVARFPQQMRDDDVPVHQVKEFAPDLSFGGSSSSPGQIALTLSDDWRGRREAMRDWAHLAVFYAAIRPEGVGRVRLFPGAIDPLVTYSLTRRDLALLRSGLARLALLLFAAGAQEVWPSVRRAEPASKPSQIPEMVGGLSSATASLMTIHLFSSTPMGERPDCPVDSFGRVKGMRNLYVNDASLLPTAPGVNPQGSIMAVAARNVGRWIEQDFTRG